MKILVLSLLRLGDVIMASSVVRGLRKEFPNAEIHLLINGQFKSVAKLLKGVDHLHFFERELVQEIIGSPQHNLLEGFYLVEELVSSLKAQGFDKVINLTHNRLSAWIAGMIECDDTFGAKLFSNGKSSFGSKWFEYLNWSSENRGSQEFHFIDAFHYGSGLNQEPRQVELAESEVGKEFVKNKGLLENKSRILIQATTSEAKKTLEPKMWKEVVQELAQLEPHREIYVLGAPNEREVINGICNGTSAQPLFCTLEEAFSVLMNCDLLISVDTSIKHLAAATPIKVIELSLGSSHIARTGIYKAGALIVQGRAPCLPCPHRGPCFQESQICAENIEPVSIAMLASAYLKHDEIGVRIIAEEFSDTAQFFKTGFTQCGDWYASPVSAPLNTHELIPWISRASTKLLLQEDGQDTIGNFGSQSIETARILNRIYSQGNSKRIVNLLREIEKSVRMFGDEVEKQLRKLKDVLRDMDNKGSVAKFVAEFKNISSLAQKDEAIRDLGDFLLHEMGSNSESNFCLVKYMKEKLINVHHRTEVEVKLIRDLQSNLMETI